MPKSEGYNIVQSCWEVKDNKVLFDMLALSNLKELFRTPSTDGNLSLNNYHGANIDPQQLSDELVSLVVCIIGSALT